MNENNNFNTVTPVEQQPVMQTSVEPQIDPSFGTNVEVPVQPVPAPTKKKSKLPVIIIVLIILAAGGFAVWKFVLPAVTKDNDKTTTSDVLASVEELKDQTIISKINKGIKYYETETVDRVAEELYTQESFKITDSKVKAYIAVLNTEYVKDQSIVDKFNSSEKNWSDSVKGILAENSEFTIQASNDNSGDSLFDGTIHDAKEVAKIYKEIFNEDFVAKDFGDIGFSEGGVMACPTFAYEPNNDVYYKMEACGGASGVYHLTYAYKYETVKNGDETMYNAYVAVGNVANTEDATYIYYSYIDTDSKESTEDEDFKITESNYEKFDKFKYVFNKDNATGNIYVDHVERVK